MKTEIRTAQDCRNHIAAELEAAGYTDREIQMFLSGATLLGYLADERASWARDFLIRKYLTNIEPFAPTISLAGEIKIDRDLFRDLLIKPF